MKRYICKLILIVYWLKYGMNSLIWLAERQSVHWRTDRRMDRATHWHSKQCSNSVKVHLILFYLGRYTINLLLTEISAHTGNICSDIHSRRMDLTAFRPYALNVRTNISSYVPWARLIRDLLYSRLERKFLWRHIFKNRTANNFKFCMFTSTIRTIICSKFQIDPITVNLLSGSGPKSPPPPLWAGKIAKCRRL